MNLRFRPSSHAWLVGGLTVLLVALAALQLGWIARWSHVEAARLEALLELGADAIDRELNGYLMSLSFRLESPPVPSDDVPGILRYWNAIADSANLVEAIYWVRPGPDPELYRLESDSLYAAAWPTHLSPWRRTVAGLSSTKLMEGLVDSLTIQSRTFPPDPPALLLPVVSEQFQGPRFLLVVLDAREVAGFLDTLVSRHLPGDKFLVRVVSVADPGVTLYDGTGDNRSIGSPDIEAGLLFNMVHKVLPTEIDAGSRSINRPLRVIAAYDRTVIHRWRLLAQHRDGSIQAGVTRIRLAQFGLALAVLVMLGMVVALMVTQARRQRTLAEAQVAFVAGVTHELRTPLAVLRSAGENLSHGMVQGEAVQRYGDIVRDEATRLANRVETILSYAGADSLHRTRVDADRVIDDALEQAQPLLNGTAVAVDAPADLPALDVDPEAVATALRNLLANAALHGGSHVHVSASLASLGKVPALALTVSDDGAGFEPDLDPFAPFVRGQRAAERQTPGSGLGLSLVRRVAEAHGGTAKAGRAASGGAKVTLTLPVAP